MSEQNTSRAVRYLPHVAVATTAVAVMPVLVVWWLHDRGIVASPWLCVGVAIALSLAASFLGSAYWKRAPGSGDIFFSELMLWGWLHRFRGERRLAKTAGLLGLGDPGGGLVDTDQVLAPSDEQVKRTTRLLREMAAALDAQDPYTDGHSRRVALHSAMVARKLGLERDQVAKIRTAAAVHDIGKLRIPLELLNKPDELSPEEFEIVKRHADEGAAIVECMDDPEITDMVRHHHERFDGAGYPSGLIGEATPLGARIIAVADTFDALTSIRPYRNAIAQKRALKSIVDVSGSQLDPAVVRAFLRCYSANRAVIFWTLLLVSPQRALAWIGGKSPGRGNLASAVTVATPAALAAVVVTAFSAAGGVATFHPPLRLADKTLAPAGAPSATKHHAKASGRSHVVAVAARRAAVLGVRRSRRVLVRRSVTGGTRPGSSSASGGGSLRASAKPVVPTKHRGAGGTTPGTFTPPPSGSGIPVAVTAPASTVSAPTAPTTSATPVGGAAGSGAGSPPTSGSTSGNTGGGAGSSGSGGGPGGSGGSGQGSGSSGSGGNGSGSGSDEPLRRDDCKDGGYMRYRFPNQGQCVAYVEQHSQH